MTLPSDLSMKEALERVAGDVESVLDSLLPHEEGPYARLTEAMRYATLAGGKRLRPFLVVASGRIFDIPPISCLRVAAALEMVHTYSLIHDDLPAMDDDDLRRGRPTTHIQFDEATAILAGDALLTLAFEVLAAEATHPDAAVRCRLIAELAKAAGMHGMVGGQMIDLTIDGEHSDMAMISRLQQMKTGALIRFAVTSGAVMAGANVSETEALSAYGRDLGLAFQIVDDLLDAEGSTAEMGKRIGKDAGQGKATFVSLLGMENARQQAKTLSLRAINHLDLFSDKADLLRKAARFAITRRT